MKSPMYNEYAEDYAKGVIDNVYNANYERPSLISMFPPLENKKVLDLGAGPGVYAEYLQKNGAQVTSIDISEKMIEILKGKLGNKVFAYAQDLSIGLPEENNEVYDLVICPLAVHYIEDMTKLFKDIKRVLKKSGEFIFSTHHPLIDFEGSPTGNYFKRELLQETWRSFGKDIEVQFYRRSFTELFKYIKDAGMYVAEFNEGKPSEVMKTLCPLSYEKLSRRPNFIFIKCVIKNEEKKNRLIFV